MSLKIAMLSTPWERTPPNKYGGIELVVSLLTEELVRRGHDVTLFATKDSETSARKRYIFNKPQRDIIGSMPIDLSHSQFCFDRARDFDIIHNHAGYSGVFGSRYVPVPTVTTLHGLFTNRNKLFYMLNKDHNYISISHSQRELCPNLNYMANIHNAIDVSKFPLVTEKDDYFVNICRWSDEDLKGVIPSIQLAARAKINLLLSVFVRPQDKRGFEERVVPLALKHEEYVTLLGELSEGDKIRALAKARAFLFPLQWREPFGLVMLEAMACGTPVIAYNRGAVPEVIIDGRTGYVCNSEAAMLQAISNFQRIGSEERAQIAYNCRQHVELNFGVKRMVDDYEEAYRKVLGKIRR